MWTRETGNYPATNAGCQQRIANWPSTTVIFLFLYLIHVQEFAASDMPLQVERNLNTIIDDFIYIVCRKPRIRYGLLHCIVIILQVHRWEQHIRESASKRIHHAACLMLHLRVSSLESSVAWSNVPSLGTTHLQEWRNFFDATSTCDNSNVKQNKSLLLRSLSK